MTFLPTLVATLSLLTFIRIVTQSSTLKASDIRYIRLRASTNLFLLPFILVVWLPKSMALSLPIMHNFLMVHLSLSSVIKHTTLVHQSIKISPLMKAVVLIDLQPQTVLKLHTFRNHIILRVDVRAKPQKFLILSQNHNHNQLRISIQKIPL